ncbi:hypothetical protein AAAC51_02855 [Priestia megaterium]
MDSTNSRSCSRICKRLYSSKRKSSISSSEALTIVKSAFKQNGAIDGSWIETTTKVIQKHGLSFYGYTGGIIRTRDAKQEHYEFFIDKKAVLLLN